MHRFWIILPVVLGLALPPAAFAGGIASVTQAAKTYIAKKESATGSQSKAAQILKKGKKLLGK